MNNIVVINDVKKLGLEAENELVSYDGDIYTLTTSEEETTKSGVVINSTVSKSFSKTILDPYLERGDLQIKEEPKEEEKEEVKTITKYVYVPVYKPRYNRIFDPFWLW